MTPRSFPIAACVVYLAAVAVGACTQAPLADHQAARNLEPLPVVPPADLAAPHAAVHDLSHGDYLADERLTRGYTIVVVGVNGDNSLSSGLAPGLVAGGYEGAVDVIDWTSGYWPLFILHLRSGVHHQRGAQAIADKVAAYQARFPREEVNLIGFSAGAEVVLEALQRLPEGTQVDRAVLLAAAVSPLHDLSTPLARCRVGLWNYYQPQDVVALWAGTLLAGTADGAHTVSAGAVGFWIPAARESPARALYDQKLVQLGYDPQMARDGNLGGHFQCVGESFVAEWVAPLLTRTSVAAREESPGR